MNQLRGMDEVMAKPRLTSIPRKEGAHNIYTIHMETIGESVWDCDTLTSEQEELGHEIAQMISDRWTVWAIFELSTKGRMRFSRLMEAVEGVTQKMLTKTLRQLERHGLVTRTLYPEVPPRVEYELTPLGHEMVVKISPFWAWVKATVPSFVEARDKFDARKKRIAADAAKTR